MKRSIVALVVALTLLAAPAAFASSRIGSVAAGLGYEVEGGSGLAYSIGIGVLKSQLNWVGTKTEHGGLGFGVTKYFGPVHTHRPYAGASLVLGKTPEGHSDFAAHARTGFEFSFGGFKVGPALDYMLRSGQSEANVGVTLAYQW